VRFAALASQSRTAYQKCARAGGLGRQGRMVTRAYQSAAGAGTLTVRAAALSATLD
jgi:hypothetical protein